MADGDKKVHKADLQTFKFQTRNREEEPTVEFTVDFGGTEQTFTLHPARVNALVASEVGPAMLVHEDSKPMWEFLNGVLAEDFPRFEKLIRHPDVVIEAGDLQALLGWMLERVNAVPT